MRRVELMKQRHDLKNALRRSKNAVNKIELSSNEDEYILRNSKNRVKAELERNLKKSYSKRIMRRANISSTDNIAECPECDWRIDRPNKLEGFTGTQYTNAKVPVNFSDRVNLYGIVGAEHLKNPDQYVNWDSPFDGTLIEYNLLHGTNYRTHNEAYADWNYTFNYAVIQAEHIKSIHAATHQAAEYMMYIMPTPSFGAVAIFKGAPALGRAFNFGSRYVDDATTAAHFAGNRMFNMSKRGVINYASVPLKYSSFGTKRVFVKFGGNTMKNGVKTFYKYDHNIMNVQTLNNAKLLNDFTKYARHFLR